MTRAAYVLFYEKRASRLDSLSDPQSWLRRMQQSICVTAPGSGEAEQQTDAEQQAVGVCLWLYGVFVVV